MTLEIVAILTIAIVVATALLGLGTHQLIIACLRRAGIGNRKQ